MAPLTWGKTVRDWDSHFPPEFDLAFYQEAYPDLAQMNEEQAHSHFEEYGRNEGRQSSAAALRKTFLTFLPLSARSLEIGPGADPVLSGRSVSYFDVHDTAGMRNWAEGVGKDPANIPEITYNDPNGNLAVIPDKFDFVFSSHCVEHQPDLLGHMNSVADLLRPGGIYAFIVPDGRFCFDALRPLSSVGDVISSHIEKHSRHSLANRIDHTVLATHNNAGDHWVGQNGPPQGDENTILSEIAAWRADPDSYVDTHAWQLTPPSLRQILTWSRDADLLKLRPLRIYDTPRGQFEFMVVMSD